MRDPRPLDIRSDSEYVCQGFSTWTSWAHVGWPGDHADLWNLLASDLLARTSTVQVMWVKGHAKRIDVLRGRTTEEDKRGNDGADALAVKGADLHAVPAEVLQARKACARLVQRMMVAVLQARFQAEGEHDNAADVADRGSDCDCIEFLNDDADDVSDLEHELDVESGPACLGAVCAASASDTEVMHASATEHISHESLNDECDRRAGTNHGVVQ